MQYSCSIGQSEGAIFVAFASYSQNKPDLSLLTTILSVISVGVCNIFLTLTLASSHTCTAYVLIYFMEVYIVFFCVSFFF